MVVTTAMQANMNHLFPVFVKLESMEILLVGGGAVGLEKLKAIVDNSPGARATVIAETILPELRDLAKDFPGVRVFQRRFLVSDLDGKDILFLATSDRRLHEEIQKEARKRKILVNVADTPDLCDFYMSSIVRKGDLKIAISTNGKSPTLAKRLKEYLAGMIPDEIQETLIRLNRIRNGIKGDFHTKVRILNRITSEWIENNGIDHGSAGIK